MDQTPDMGHCWPRALSDHYQWYVSEYTSKHLLGLPVIWTCRVFPMERIAYVCRPLVLQPITEEPWASCSCTMSLMRHLSITSGTGCATSSSMLQTLSTRYALSVVLYDTQCQLLNLARSCSIPRPFFMP